MNRPLNHYFPQVSSIASGCMGLGGGWDNNPVSAEHRHQASALIDAALENGINLFDHADIYTWGKAEKVFGQVLAERPLLREQMILQSKCGIRFADEHAPARYDLSRDWIVTSVENTLKRLQTDYLDILLLHRPDPLLDTQEVAEAFEQLKTAGKVRQFGVSNMNAAQMALLQSGLDQPLVASQLEISMTRLDWLNEGVEVNNGSQCRHNFSSGVLEYCRLQGVQLQAWGCLSQGYLTGRDVSGQPESVQNTAALVQNLSDELGISREAVVLAWLMRHPAGIQPVVGTSSPERLRACGEAMGVELSREHWYQLYIAARGNALP